MQQTINKQQNKSGEYLLLLLSGPFLFKANAYETVTHARRRPSERSKTNEKERDRIEEQINNGNVIIDDDDRERKKERGRGAQTTNRFALCKVHEPLSQGLLVYIV